MILVTGATGHIGNVLVRELVSRGEKVRAFLLRGEDASPLEGLAVERVEGNVLEPSSLRGAMEGVHTVFHLAGIITILPGKNDWVHQVNVEGTRNVIRACRESGVKRLVYTSSIHAIRREAAGVIDESVPFDPDNAVGIYDRSKAHASLAVLKAVEENGLDAVIVCPTGVIGPYDFLYSEMGAVIRDILHKKLPFLVKGAYDFVDVRDVAVGHILAAEKGRCGQVYILSGERITVEEVVQVVEKNTGQHPPHIQIPFGLARFAARFTPLYYRISKKKPRFTSYSLETLVSNSNIRCEKARRELGFSPRSLQESIRDTVEWFVERQKQVFFP